MKTDPIESEDLIDEREVSRRLGVALSTVRYWRFAGTGPLSKKIGGFLVRYPATEVERFRIERERRNADRGAK